jgi:hypothetical protein
MRFLLIVLAILFGVPALAVVGLQIYQSLQIQSMQKVRDDYYSRHHLLRAMHDSARISDGRVETHGSGPRRVVLSKLPVGTQSEEIFSKLSSEDFDCHWPSGFAEKRLIVCGRNDEARAKFVPRWHIEVMLDEAQRLSDVRVLMLKG